ncbi:hypothetical protein [Dapis sp. BLCC M229]|uniref:hypothetical protein n=1 Tax=Dapis sp. BLCC M229 TaxID=3400188 RepID=UPI003CE9C0C9
MSDKIHSCPDCRWLCRDKNATANIKHRAVGHSVLKACGVRRDTGTGKREDHTIASA